MAEFIFREATEEEEDNAIAANFHKYSALEVQDDKGLNVKPLSKIDTMLYDLQYWGETHGVKPLGDLATGIKAIKDTEYKRVVPEFTKSVTRAANTLLVKNVAGGGMSVVGRMLYADNGNEDDVRVKVNHAIFGTIRDFGDSIKKTSEEWNNSNLLKPDEKYFVGTFEQNPNLIRALDLAASGSSSLVAAYALAPVVGPEMAILAMSGADCMDVFDESLAAGNGKLKSLGLFSLATVGTAAMEKLPVEKAFGVKFTKKGLEKVIDSTKKTSVKIAEAMLAEGGTEGLQTVYQNTIAKVGYDNTRDIFEGAVEAIIGGALGGGMVSGVNFGYESFVNRAKKSGLNDQDIDNVLNETAQTMADKPELIDVPFQENMKKTYQSFEKMIADLGDTPEAQRLIAKKQALDNVYNQYFETFKQKMPENQAKANAQLVRSSALYFADLDGISVDEWLKTKAPQIKWIGDIENQERTFERSVTPTKLTLDEKEVNLFEALKNPELVKQYRKKDRRKSLLQFIRKRGGVKDVGGDLKAMDINKQFRGVINNKNGESLDDMARAAWEYGYFTSEERPTINDLLEAIRDESFGNKRYAEEKELGIDDYVAQLAEEMDRLGIDYSNMSAREAEQAYNDAVAKYSNQNYVPAEQSADEDTDALFDLSEPFFQIAEENAKLDAENPAYDGETININGQEKTVYNSNGDRIAKSKEALENFYKWFGDSKVVDEQGRPLVVYHGTNAEFSVFDITKVGESTRNKGIFGYGFYSSNKEKIASSYRRTKGNLLPEGQGYIMPLYYKLENPFMWFQGGRFKEAKESIEIAKKLGFPKERIQDDGDGFIRLLPLTEDKQIEKFTQSLKDNGYDGVIFKYSGTDLFEYVAFNPNQIKSTSNRGTYSESENIYLQSAFAGSRVDYDRPSLEAIGSGEGHAAHGWGLYYALNKDVAEDYRKKFIYEAPADMAVQDYKRLMLIADRGKQFFIDKLNELIDIREKLNKAYNKSDEIYNKIRDIEKEERLADDAFLFDEETEARKKQKAENKEKLSKLHKQVDEANNDIDKINHEYTKAITPDADVVDFMATIDNRYSIDALKEALKEVQDTDVSKAPKGQVHEVDLPENPYLLDEQKMLGEQSMLVKKALRGVAKQVGVKWDNRYDNGKYIYDNIANVLGSKKAASQMLEKYGIKGITYDGRQDGRCFVIFNPDDVKVIQKFYQRGKADSYLGAYTNRIIYLNQNANESTLPHELAHFWSDMLRQSKSLKAKEILKQVDKWAEKEFERKYSIAKQGDVYVVTDKSGKTVYDLMGEGFKNEENAKAYAKEELFARGFEKYLREGGKAPSRTLKSAFNNFYNWLKKIYVDLANLDIKLSPAMRNLYGELLGGTNIDTFLSEDLDSFIEQRQIADEEREQFVEQQSAQMENAPVVKKRDLQFAKTWDNLFVPLSTRAKRINPKLRNKLRRYEHDVLQSNLNYKERIMPMLQKWKTFSPEDKFTFDLALKNNTPRIRDRILQKYDAEQEFKAVQDVLEEIHEQAINAGLDVGYIEDYYPRKVDDVNGLLSYLHGTEQWSAYQQAFEQEFGKNANVGAEEQAEFMDKFLRGIKKADVAGYKYSSEKARKLDTIDNTLNQYYADSLNALLDYIDGMNARIQSANFFGRNRNNVEESIGEFVDNMVNNGEIKPQQVDEVKDILKAVFGRRGVSWNWLKKTRDVAYIYTMGGVNTAITQIDDIFVAAYKGGVFNTIKTLMGEKPITKKDLGLENIAAEFVNGDATSKMVNKVFKATGLDFIDSIGKNTLINSVYNKMRGMTDEQLRKYIEPIMEDETQATIDDIRNNDIHSDRVRFFLFNELSDMQPISLSELPALYNTGGNARIFYMLKSFMLKRIDTYRNEVFDKIKNGNRQEKIEGMQNLFKLMLLMMLGGASKDALIDLLYGRKTDLSDMVINNLLGLVGISKYNIYQARQEGFGHTVALFAFPPIFQVADDLFGDVDKFLKGKRELKDFEALKGLPIIGRFYYWWIGRGREKEKKKKKRA